MNHGGVLDYPVLPPALPCHVPPPANLRGGTGVFLPRVEAYRYATTPPATAKGNARTTPHSPTDPCCIARAAAVDGWTDGCLGIRAYPLLKTVLVLAPPSNALDYSLQMLDHATTSAMQCIMFLFHQQLMGAGTGCRDFCVHSRAV